MVILLFCPVHTGIAASPAPQVHISVWYWLNSAPRTQWPADFTAIRNLGFTDVVLVWGLDASAFATRFADLHEAIRSAHAAGIGSSLFIWHARHNALPHARQFEQIDAAGNAFYAFDAFNPLWRKTQWKPYLQTIAHEYASEPGMAGYVFDNSFAIGNIAAIDGPAPQPRDSYLSYGDAENEMFGKQPPRSPQDPAWHSWIEARRQWWADWAADTRDAIRTIDPDLHHRIICDRPDLSPGLKAYLQQIVQK